MGHLRPNWPLSWDFRCGCIEVGRAPEDARDAILDLRTVILEVSGLDPRTEPFPLIGRTAERDLVNLASYLGSLVHRAAAVRGCSPEDLVELAVGSSDRR